MHIVEGPQPIDGTWTFEPEGAGTKVGFEAEGELRGSMRFLAPIVQRLMAREFASYHRKLRANLRG